MDLFTKVDDVRISRLDQFDVKRSTDRYLLFRNLLAEHEPMYPSILKWFDSKVSSDISVGSRVAYLGFNNDTPIAAAVVKLGRRSKFCHLSIKNDFQNRNIGELFFAMMALDVKRMAEEIYFTLPENLWETKEQFFRSFGFREIGESGRQYRTFEKELVCRADFKSVWVNSLRKLPKIITSQVNANDSIFSGILMSIRPAYLDKILANEKVVEIRRQFNKDFEGSRVTLYATSPTKQICGYAIIEHVIVDKPSAIWMKFEHYLGCTHREFEDYTRDCSTVFAIFLSNVEAYRNPVPLTQLSYWLDQTILPPQSYFLLNNNHHWAKAISIAEMLQGRFKTYTQIDSAH